MANWHFNHKHFFSEFHLRRLPSANKRLYKSFVSLLYRFLGKNSNRDGGSTALKTVDTVDMFYTVDTVD